MVRQERLDQPSNNTSLVGGTHAFSSNQFVLHSPSLPMTEVDLDSLWIPHELGARREHQRLFTKARDERFAGA